MNVNEGTYRERVVRAEIRPDRVMSGKQRRVEARFEPRTEVNGKTWVVKNGRRRRLGRWEGGRKGRSDRRCASQNLLFWDGLVGMREA